MNGFPAIRAGYGTFLLVAPDTIGRLAAGQPVDVALRRIIRLVGARHVAQAVLTARTQDPATLAVGAGVDLAHAATMLALTAWDRRRRRPALISASTACSFALTGLILARRRRRGGLSGCSSRW